MCPINHLQFQHPDLTTPGQVIAVDYTLGTFTQVNINWIIAFQINLGVGWTNLIPLIAPGNPGGSTGGWIWDVQNTYPSGLNFGPGWRFINISGFGILDWGTSINRTFYYEIQNDSSSNMYC